MNIEIFIVLGRILGKFMFVGVKFCILFLIVYTIYKALVEGTDE